MIVLRFTICMFIICIFINGSGKVQGAQNVLKMLFPIFRHGSSSPSVLIPNDPYNKKWNKIGVGALTNEGKAQQLLNGQLTKARYSTHFGPIFNDSQLYVQTSTISRTVMSAQCFTAGIFPPTQNEVWTDETIGSIWQPIPTYSTFTQLDSPQYFENYTNYFDSEILPASQRDFLQLIINKTRFSPRPIFYLFDPFLCESYLNYKLPFGLENYKQDMVNLSNFMFEQALLPSYPKYAGTVLFDLANRIDTFNNGSSGAKTVVYSLHDLFVAAVMLALTNQTVGVPPFSSTIYIEVYGQPTGNSSDYVMFWYRPTVYSNVTSYNITNCGHKCPMNQFKNIINKLIVTST